MKPNLMISLKIAELYPNHMGYMAIYDDEIDKWNGAIIKVNNSKVEQGALERGEYPVIFSTNNYKWDNEDDALLEVENIVDEVLKVIKIMSN